MTAGPPRLGTALTTVSRPLRQDELTRALQRPGGLWSAVRVVAQTGSTNADVAALARAGAGEGLVLIAESQSAGRGRMGRAWQAPPGTGLTMSVLLRPRSVPPAALGWLPLLAGVAVVGACGWSPGLDGALKWPNDLLVRSASSVGRSRPLVDGWGKCGGILAEAVEPGTVVVGIGINVSQVPAELPAPADASAYPATSLAMAGVRRDREDVAVAVLRGLSDWYGRWLDAGGDAVGCGLREAYRRHCATLGQAVTVLLPGGGRLRGTASDIDPDGRLVVATGTGEHRLAAGDVHHVRARPPRRSRQRVARAGRPVDDPPFQGRVPLAPDD